MQKLFHFIKYWLPPLAVMAVIFALSSRQRIQVSEVDTVNFMVFKSLHMVEYAVLFFLWFRALYQRLGKAQIMKAYALAITISILYGALDELHQTFVPTREGKLRDVVIDSIGILLMFEYTKHHLNKLKLFL
ncbi:MAG: VanZ family protein [Weeksellaceae bacterium]